jgi:hypothetical protein
MICQKCGRALIQTTRGLLCPQGCAYPLHPMVTRNDSDATLTDWQVVGDDPDKAIALADALATGDAAVIFALAEAWGIERDDMFLVSGLLTRMARHALDKPTLTLSEAIEAQGQIVADLDERTRKAREAETKAASLIDRDAPITQEDIDHVAALQAQYGDELED